MAKYELKTRKNEASVADFLNRIGDEGKRADCKTILGLIQNAVNSEPRMWGESIVGFGTYRYKNSSGGDHEWMRIGFSPRKQNIVIYIMDGLEKYRELLSQLGKYRTGKSCLYFKRLNDVDENVLNDLIKLSVDHFNKRYGKN